MIVTSNILVHVYIIESVDSISRDGPDTPYMWYITKTLITQSNLNFKIFNFHIHNLRQNIYLESPKHIHGNNQVYQNKLCKEITKSAKISIFVFPGLTQDSLDRSPWFEHKSSPFWSAHVCGMLVLCYHDSDLILGVYRAFCEWVCLIGHFVI